MIGGMCRFTRLRGRVSYVEAKKAENDGHGREEARAGRRGQDGQRKGKRRKYGAGSARRCSYNWCNTAIKGITRIDDCNFRGKWRRTILPLFGTTRRCPSFYSPLSLSLSFSLLYQGFVNMRLQYYEFLRALGSFQPENHVTINWMGSLRIPWISRKNPWEVDSAIITSENL